MSQFTEAVMERIATEAAEKAAKQTVQELFMMLGVDVSTPAGIIEVQKDFASVRQNRLARLAIQSKAVMTAIGIITSGVLATLWLSLKGH
jgi:hypothetical protein